MHGDTKTEKSRRTLALPQSAVAALREHRQWQAEARLAAGPLWQDTGLVFTTSVGTPAAPEGVPALIAACQAAGWRVVVFSTPAGTQFVDPAELERLTGEPVRSEYRLPGTGTPVPPAAAVLACPLTFNSVNKFAHGHETSDRLHLRSHARCHLPRA